MIFILLSLLMAVLIWPTGAQAYLDPGAGSYITQLIIGFAVGGIYIVRGYWGKISLWLKNKMPQRSKNDKE